MRFSGSLPRRLALICIAFLVSVAALAGPVVSADGIPWEFEPLPGGFVAIGDIHGDLQALREILLRTGLISPDGGWIGGARRLVLLGDLIDRGPEARAVMDFVIDLEKSAASRSGAVHSLLGNHEMLVTSGDYRYLSERDYRTFFEFADPRWPLHRPEAQGEAVRLAFSGDTKYAKWIRSRNSIVRIGGDLFIHAGLKNWGGAGAAEINSSVRAWARAFQKAGPRPPAETRWVIASDGPLWTREMATSRPGLELLSAPELESELRRFGAERVIVGHTPQQGLELHHKLYGRRVILADTAISGAMGGMLTAVVMAEGELIAREFSRPPRTSFREYPTTAKSPQAQKSNMESYSEPNNGAEASLVRKDSINFFNRCLRALRIKEK